MKHAFALVCFSILTAATLIGAEDWVRPYLDGVSAIERQDWSTAETLLAQAIAIKASEEASVKLDGRTGTYLPHYWLGVARLGKGDPSAALIALKESDRQGAIRKTTMYASLKDNLARATEAIDTSTSATLTSAKTEADRALAAALNAQVAASKAGAGRLEEYRKGSSRLQEAFAAKKAATLEGYKSAVVAARQATDLFNRARLRVQSHSPAPEGSPEASPLGASPDPANQAGSGAAAEPARALPADPSPVPERPAVPSQPPERGPAPPARAFKWTSEMRSAYDLYSQGKVLEASDAFAKIVRKHPQVAQAWLMRGVCEWTLAHLKEPGDWDEQATRNLQHAASLDSRLRLDPQHFPPQLVEHYDQIRANAP